MKIKVHFFLKTSAITPSNRIIIKRRTRKKLKSTDAECFSSLKAFSLFNKLLKSIDGCGVLIDSCFGEADAWGIGEVRGIVGVGETVGVGEGIGVEEEPPEGEFPPVFELLGVGEGDGDGEGVGVG